MMTRTRIHLAPLLLTSALAVSACGSGDDSQGAEPAEPAASAAADDEQSDASTPAADEEQADDDKDHSADDDKDHDDDHDEDHDEDHDDGDPDDEHDHDEGSAGLGAHEHGTAELSVAWIGAEVAVDLISPTFNVFGFEYEPTTDEDLAIEADRTEAITASGMVSINDEAGCALSGRAGTETEREGSHSEISVSWLYVCDDPDEIDEVDLSELFTTFPSFEEIDAQWISESEQSSAALSPSSPTLSLRS